MQLDKFEIISMVGGYWKLAASIVHSISKFVISNLKKKLSYLRVEMKGKLYIKPLTLTKIVKKL